MPTRKGFAAERSLPIFASDFSISFFRYFRTNGALRQNRPHFEIMNGFHG
jgi:hypothetical protein